MDSRDTRSQVITGLLVLLAASMVYSLSRGEIVAPAFLAFLTLGIFAAVRLAEFEDPHQINLSQKKSYDITLKSVIATSFVTGGLMVVLLFASGVVIAGISLFAGVGTFSQAVLAGAIERLQLFLGLSVPSLLTVYVAASASAGTGFWVLYPYLPVQDEEIAGPLTFVISWMYLVGAGHLLGFLEAGNPLWLAIDAAIFGLWGHFFSVAYEEIEKHVP